mgnify:CR=1 FL=1
MLEALRAWVPITAEAFEDYRLSGAAVSGPGLKVLRGLLDPAALADEAGLEALRVECAMSAREFNELIALLRSAS